jgi:hypothetical protein
VANTVHDHLGERAELYALGMLDGVERGAVETHLATCAECRRRVGEAEETLLEMDRRLRSQPPPAELDRRVRASRRGSLGTRGFSWYALAAAFLIGLLPSIGLFANRMHAERVESARTAATIAMVDSHFAHAQFAAIGGKQAPDAKVVFARDRSWLYVIVVGAKSYDVAAAANGAMIPLGATQSHGGASELFVRNPPRAKELVLLDDHAPVARASIGNASR